jgi:hypothetical protein
LEAAAIRRDQDVERQGRLLAQQDETIARKDEIIARKDEIIARKDEIIARKDNELAELQAQLEEARRAAKRQAAPFSKRAPKERPKTPGRKAGEAHGTHAHRAAPDHIDQMHDVPLPGQCPCGCCEFEVLRVEAQYQTEIPRRPIVHQFNVVIGRCRQCGRQVQGRHPLQTSDALGAAASQLGPRAQAAVVMLNKDLGLSHRMPVSCSSTWKVKTPLTPKEVSRSPSASRRSTTAAGSCPPAPARRMSPLAATWML